MKSTFILMVIICTLLITSCNFKRASENQADIEALKVIKEEPNVIEAFYTDSNVLYVSVEDNGSNRDGFASYLCSILKEHNAITNYVKIVRVGSMRDPNRDNAYGVKLGECHCND